MPTVDFEGQSHVFPDDFTDQDIALALSNHKPAAAVNTSAAAKPVAMQTVSYKPPQVPNPAIPTAPIPAPPGVDSSMMEGPEPATGPGLPRPVLTAWDKNKTNPVNVKGTPEYNAAWVIPPSVQQVRDQEAGKMRLQEVGGDLAAAGAQIAEMEKVLNKRGADSIQGTARKILQQELRFWKIAVGK